jgi:hypothetical protein
MIGAVAGCFEKEKINIQILYKNDTYDVEITKGTKLDIAELDFVSNKSDAFLLYGENFDTKYNNEVLTEDTVFLACDYSGTELLGTFYTLQDAYTQGIISDGDLQDVYNNYITPNKPKLDKQVELKILNDSLVELRYRNTEASLEDVSIYGYYGNYNNVYVIRLDDTFTNYPTVDKELKIGNVTFEYSGPSFLVWVDGFRFPALTDEISYYIRNAFATMITDQSAREWTVEDTHILYYLGKYGESYVAMIEGDRTPTQPASKEIKVGDLWFEIIYGYIRVYNNNKCYYLWDAYELGLISDEQLLDIYNGHQEYLNNQRLL